MATGEQTVPPWQREGVQFWSMVFIQAPRERVFEYLTRGEHTAKYYMGMAINDPSEEGAPVWFGASEEAAAITGRVTAYRYPERFAHTFRFRHRAEEAESFVAWELHEEGPDLTCLVLRHHGFTDREAGTYNDVCFGWSTILSNLKTLLETGEALRYPPPPQRREEEEGSR